MIIRASGILHLAQGELLMIGSMAGISALWASAVPFWALMAAGMLAGAAAATFIELSVYRPLRSLGVHHINLVISTLGVSIVLQNVARLIWGSEPISYPPLLGSTGLDLGGIVISVQLIAIISVSAAFMVGLQLFF